MKFKKISAILAASATLLALSGCRTTGNAFGSLLGVAVKGVVEDAVSSALALPGSSHERGITDDQRKYRAQQEAIENLGGTPFPRTY